jgi:hypothetical protein
MSRWIARGISPGSTALKKWAFTEAQFPSEEATRIFPEFPQCIFPLDEKRCDRDEARALAVSPSTKVM